MNKIRLAIIEDVKNIRNSLKEFFESQEETECLFACDSMESFFEKIKADNKTQVALKESRADIVLIDIGLPGMNGIEGMKRIKMHWPDTSIIMLTVFKDNDKIFKSVRAGAMGYILKDTPFHEIKKAIIDIANGGSYMSPSIARKIMEYFSPDKNKSKELLTQKEKQIITSLTEGLSYKMIADDLLMSIDGVRFHIRNIYKKLQVNSKSEVIVKALKGEL